MLSMGLPSAADPSSMCTLPPPPGSAFLDLAHVAPQTVRCAALVVPGSLHPGAPAGLLGLSARVGPHAAI